MYILIAVLVFGFLIFIHELGHYIAARSFHVKIYEFAIGMGPRLFWFESKKTGIVYALRMIPFGGFVSMEGELSVDGEKTPEAGEQVEENGNAVVSDVPPETEIKHYPGEEKLGPLAAKPAWQRLIVHAAGATMNLLFGFLAAIILTCILRVGGTTVAEFIPPSEGNVSSQEQGLAVGDEILRVNGKRVHISDQLYYEIMHSGGSEEPLALTVRRNGETVTVNVKFPTLTESGQSFGDYDFKVYAEKKNPGVLIKQSFYKSCYMVNMVWDSLIDLVSGRYSFEAVSGPVGTATVISDAAKTGASSLLYLTALISVNLGIFNILPLPALDGGHIFYTLAEMITRKKLPPKVIGILDTVGFILLFGLMIVVTAKDIFGLI